MVRCAVGVLTTGAWSRVPKRDRDKGLVLLLTRTMYERTAVRVSIYSYVLLLLYNTSCRR